MKELYLPIYTYAEMIDDYHKNINLSLDEQSILNVNKKPNALDYRNRLINYRNQLNNYLIIGQIGTRSEGEQAGFGKKLLDHHRVKIAQEIQDINTLIK